MLMTSARKKSPKKDRQSNVLFDATRGHGLCMLDSEGNIISWNTTAERMMGYGTQEVIGKSYSVFFTKEDLSRKIFKKSLVTATRTGRSIVEGIRVRKNGSQFWARSFISLVKQGKGGGSLFRTDHTGYYA
ncbi:MAG: PAS/PAC sensor-containing diguanylate cyclase/phosphodiesterase [Parcubacteria group bacterium Gr01-1014_56]|nr:MAG: PAS/PAC sensor-containing diguanylate cyclase/phosphodiesterase [Parcubacteria group bacterium Gr01-1014_56]